MPAASLGTAGNQAYGIGVLHDDLARFAFLHGGQRR
jgi:hypothetical protein